MLKKLFSVMGSSQSLSHQSAVETINQWRSRPPHELIFDSGRHQIRNYFQAITKLQQTNENDKLIAMATDRLKTEFEAVLRRADPQAAPTSTTELSTFSDSTANAFRYEDYPVPDALNKDVIDYLRSIAEMMNSCGRVNECVKTFKRVRKGYLQSRLKPLRVDELRADHYHDELKVKMELWVEVSKICVKKLFEKERKLCGDLFGNVSFEARDDCFVGTVKDSAMLLFRFVEEMSLRRLPYDKMGVVLGVYDAFMLVLPEADDLFISEQGKGIRDVLKQVLLGIEKDVVRMLYDLEKTVLHERFTDVSEDRGAVHRTTEVVIMQIDHIVRNKNVLTELIKSAPSLVFDDVSILQQELIDYSSINSSFLEQHLALIILVLLKNIKKKAGSSQDQCLGKLFVMNNIRYIVQKIEGCDELQEMVAARLLSKLSDQLASARIEYETLTCDELLSCLRKEGLYINLCCFKERPRKAAIKRRMVAVNEVVEKIKDVHSSWTIPDDQLRAEVRRSMSERLVPPYRSFLQDLGDDPETKVVVEGNRKHSAEDLEILVHQILFANN